MRANKDKDHNSRNFTLSFLPTFLIEFIAYISGYLSSNMGIPLSCVGLKSYPFGSLIITSVGMLGYEHAFAPIPRKLQIFSLILAFTNVPLIVTVGSIVKKPVVVDNQIVIRPIVNVTITLDHRFTDGARASAVYRKFVNFMRDPENIEKEQIAA